MSGGSDRKRNIPGFAFPDAFINAPLGYPGPALRERKKEALFKPFSRHIRFDLDSNKSQELDLTTKGDGDKGSNQQSVIIPLDYINAPMRSPRQSYIVHQESEEQEYELLEANSAKSDKVAVSPSQECESASLKYRKFLSSQNAQAASNAVSLGKRVVQQNTPFKLIIQGKFTDLDLYNILKVSFKNADNGSVVFLFVESIFDNMFAESINAVAVAKYIFVLSHDHKRGGTLRSLFFKFLQKYYQERKTVLSRGIENFKNFARFFAAAVHHNRYPPAAPFEALLSGLLELAEMLSVHLESYEDLKFFCLLLVRVTQYLKMDPKLYSNSILKKLAKIKGIARRKCKELMNVRIKQTESLIWLMMVLDDIRYPDALDFYINNLEQHEILPVLEEEYQILLPKQDLPLYKNIDTMKNYLTIIY